MTGRRNDVVSPKAVAVGALIALAVAVPVAILARAVDGADSVDDDSSWVLVLFLVVVAALALGGFVAGRQRPDAPLANGALAGLAAYVTAQTAGAIRLMVVGEDVSWGAIPMLALLATTAGLGGGLLADRQARRPSR